MVLSHFSLEISKGVLTNSTDPDSYFFLLFFRKIKDKNMSLSLYCISCESSAHEYQASFSLKKKLVFQNVMIGAIRVNYHFMRVSCEVRTHFIRVGFIFAIICKSVDLQIQSFANFA